MRKAKLYLRTFWLTILLVIVGVLGWIYIPHNLDNFRDDLISSALGIGISISIAEVVEKLVEHRRVKRTLGFLKLITIQYLDNQVENFNGFLKQNEDISSLEHARAFIIFVTNFDTASAIFDKNWFQLVYSSDFIDAINSDSQLNTIALAVSEVLIFTKTLTWLSMQAKHLCAVDVRQFSRTEIQEYIRTATGIRDDLAKATQKLEKYTKNLNSEILTLFSQTGVKYEEFDR